MSLVKDLKHQLKSVLHTYKNKCPVLWGVGSQMMVYSANMCVSKTNNLNHSDPPANLVTCWGTVPQQALMTMHPMHLSLAPCLTSVRTIYFPSIEKSKLPIIPCICMNHDQFVFHWSVSIIFFSCFLVVNIQDLVLTRLIKYVSYLIVHKKFAPLVLCSFCSFVLLFLLFLFILLWWLVIIWFQGFLRTLFWE